MITVGLPQAGQTDTVSMEEGKTYVLGFDPRSSEMVLQDGSLVITLNDGSQLVLQGFESAVQSNNAPTLQLADGYMIGGLDLLVLSKTVEQQDEPARNVQSRTANNEEEMAAIAEKLAETEPAAGEAGGGAASRGGFGFQSSVDPAPLGAPPPVGPIGPTELRFGLPKFDTTLYTENQEAPAPQPPGPPSIGANDVFVYEDNSVLLNMLLSAGGATGVDSTFVLSGIPSTWGVNPGAGTYDAAAGTWTIVLVGGGTFSGGPVLSPPADSDENLPNLLLTATNTSTVTGLSTTLTSTVNVFTDAVADVPTLVAQDATGVEDAVLPVQISTSVTDVDGSETITFITIANVPAGFTLSAGTYDAVSGLWTLSPAELAGLTMTPPAGYFGSVTLDVVTHNEETNKSDSDFDSTNDTNSNTDQMVLTWKPVVNPPDIKVNNGVDDAIVKEDGTVDVPIVANLGAGGSGNEILTVTVTGINPSWGFSALVGTYNAATGTWTAVLPAGQNLSTVMTFTPPADSDLDLTGLVAIATAFEPATSTSASANDGFNIITDAVADAPGIDVSNASTAENTLNTVGVTSFLADLDGSELITGYQISGVPSGFSFNQGTDLGGGIWSFTPAQVAGLTMSSPANYNGTITLTATVFNTENPVSDGEDDFTDNNNSASDQFTLTWTPVINPPYIVVNDGIDDAFVKEDGSVVVPITAALGADPSPSEYLTVTVTGISSSWGFSAPVGTYNPATGTWTVILAAGQNLDTAFTFTPPANSDIDLNGLVATVVATDPSSGLSASDSDAFRVVTDAVADVPTITASAPFVEQGTPVSITINAAVTDTDGSETITGYRISSVLDGFTFNQGTNLGGGVWEFTPAEIVGLTLTAPSDYYGIDYLTVTALNAETNLSGTERDLFDNTNSNSTQLKIYIQKDDVPEVSKPPAKTVDETGLDTGIVVATGAVTVDFFSDAPGTIIPSGAGTFTYGGSYAGTALTSNGQPIQVTLSGNTYTGKAGGNTVFTLQVDANGDFVFNLLGTMDHRDAANPDDVITLNFGVTAVDSDGDAVTTQITINVRDDGVDAVDDSNLLDTATATLVSGNVLANDDLSQDGPNAVSKIQFGNVSVDVPASGQATINGAHGILNISANGAYTYTFRSDSNNSEKDSFVYTLVDSDGDVDTAKLDIDLVHPAFIVGKNVDDKTGSSTPYQVGPGTGTINGGGSTDILVGDVGGSNLQNVDKDYNIVLILDVSGSMQGSKLTLLKQAVNNLLEDFHDYQGGDVKVHIVPFADKSQTAGTFTVTTGSGFSAAASFINNLSANGYTNYESPLQSAINWLQGNTSNDPIAGATTFTYFVSDGEPNRYVDNGGTVASGNADRVMNEITGVTDSSNEVAVLQGYGEVVGVGIGVNGTTLGRLSVIDTGNDSALDVQDPSDLSQVLQGASPLNQLSSVGGDVINGGNGNDVIFGDALNTDVLAQAQGINVPAGSGWDVFARLEAGQSALTPAWNRADTINYIRTHAVDLAAESLGSGGAARSGGNDVINGGAGDDAIFGQEGNDIITGGAGDDLLYGGSGADTFVFNAATDGTDTIMDFDIVEGDQLDLSTLLGTVGFDPLTDAINNFVFATDTAQGTVIQVDLTGSGNVASATTVALIDGIHGLSLNDLVSGGSLVTS